MVPPFVEFVYTGFEAGQFLSIDNQAFEVNDKSEG